jgi:hypothetical protein
MKPLFTATAAHDPNAVVGVCDEATVGECIKAATFAVGARGHIAAAARAQCTAVAARRPQAQCPGSP